MTATISGGLSALLQVIYEQYNHDFRDYSMASLQRRMEWALRRMRLNSLDELRLHILENNSYFSELLQHITVPVSTMFRDPLYFSMLRRHVLPVLKTYASPRIWVAGCATGEEAYSLAILLHEENLLERSLIYATDINPVVLGKAARGIFPIDKVPEYTDHYHHSGGRRDFSAYYHAAYGYAIFDKRLRKHIVFNEHSLATDSAFAEVQFISCRNVLIYFTRELQDRAYTLFHESLCRKGYLGLGARESLDFSRYARSYIPCEKNFRLFRKTDLPLHETDQGAAVREPLFTV